MRWAILGAVGASPFARDRELRMLEYAIGASIALHVLALAALQQVAPRPEPADQRPPRGTGRASAARRSAACTSRTAAV
jgi:hypothetical protein